jgi:hypothetical protein
MTNMHCTRHRRVAGSQKVKHLTVLTFFSAFLLTAPSHASTNWADGLAYGTNFSELATNTWIQSRADTNGSLIIGFADTDRITLTNDITGYIRITNHFSSFEITATNSSVSSSAFAALQVAGGTNLTITGGAFKGVTSTNGIILPPLPGEDFGTNTVFTSAKGGHMYDVDDVRISGTDFSGGTDNIDAATSRGTEGLWVGKSKLTLGGSSTLKGGNGANRNSSTEAVLSIGGTALMGIEADITISNGTFRGGSGGDAVSSSGFSATSIGGAAVYATSNSTLEIVAGTFEGGAAGSASSAGAQAVVAGGSALVLDEDSSAVIHAGTFKGASGSEAVSLRNSHLMTHGGTFTQGGLVSQVSSGRVSRVELQGGTFSKLTFQGTDGGMHYLTAGTNLTVQDKIIQNGGSITVTNLSNDAFADVEVNDGTMAFTEEFVLQNGGSFMLNGEDSFAGFTLLSIAPDAVFHIGTARANASSNLTVNSGGTLQYTINNDDSGLLEAGSALFFTNSVVKINASEAGFFTGTTNVSVLTTTGGISVVDSNGTQTATTELFTNTVDVAVQTSVNTNESGRSSALALIENSSSDLVIRFQTLSLAEYWNVTNGPTYDLANELDSLSNATMNAIINSMSGDEGRIAAEQTYFTIRNTFQTSMLGLQAAVGQSVSRGTEFREQLKLIPRGARGPESKRNNDLRGWGKYYGQFYSHDAEGLNQEYDTTLHGGVIGVDKSFDRLLVGVSGGGGRYSTETDNDHQEDINAFHGAIYGTYGAERAYLDAGVAYGFNDVETETADPFVLNGEFDAQLVSAYFGGGYDLIDTEGGTVFTPEASIQYTTYTQDAYTETSDTAVPREIDEFDADSLRSSLGLNLSMLNTTAADTFGFKLDGRFHWLHEFNPDPGTLSFNLEGGSNIYLVPYPHLDENLYRAGFGFTFFNTERRKPKNVLLRLDFDELFGDGFNSHNLSAKVVYAF